LPPLKILEKTSFQPDFDRANEQSFRVSERQTGRELGPQPVKFRQNPERAKFPQAKVPFSPNKKIIIFRPYAKEKISKKSEVDEIELKNSKKAIYSYAKNKDSPKRPKNANLLTQDQLNSNSGYLMPDKKNLQVKSMGTFGVNAVGKKPVGEGKDLLSQDGDNGVILDQNFSKKKGLISFNKLRYL
jgi:hypothetical protein